ncbi:12217_t:CDS:10 [Entrophospora sp. SA101]|nr:12217_t:CDS:10 [Entrophospora sp. SA101]
MPLLITIEGIDGSGKKIWHLLNESRTEGKSENKTIVIDRYIDSTFAYQGLENGIKISSIQEVVEKTSDLPLPDITFILDIDPRTAHERLKNRKKETGEYSNWDKLDLDFHHRIRNHYLELKKFFPERICIIDANKNETEILTEVQAVIKGCLPENTSEKGETPEITARREVFEETNLVVENLEKITEGKVFYANLPPGNQHWQGYFFQAYKYSGEIRNKEVEKILDIKFLDYHSPKALTSGHAYQTRKYGKKNEPVAYDSPLILVGGQENYEPRSLSSYGAIKLVNYAIKTFKEENIFSSHLRKKLAHKFLAANFSQTQKEKFILTRYDSDAQKVGTLAARIYNRTYYYHLEKNKRVAQEDKNFKELSDNVEYIKTVGAEKEAIKKNNNALDSNLKKKLPFVFAKATYATIPTHGGYDTYCASLKQLNKSFIILEKNADFPAKSTKKLLPKSSDINLEKVVFSYPETKKKVLDNFSFTFEKGEKYGIAGPNGVGKSTLFRLIVKLYQPHLGNNILYPDLYQETIHKKKLEKIAKKLGMKEFMDKLPARQNLSEGQKQLVSLMRVFIKDYQIYLFDEFLSNVATDLKEKILPIVFQELDGKTVIVIIFKPAIDNRYSKSELVSHAGEKITAIPIKDIQEIEKYKEKFTSVFIDEIHFFPPEAISYLNELVRQNKEIIVAGLD